MKLTADRPSSGEPPKPSRPSSIAGYVLLAILFGGGGAFVIPLSHSILLGVFWVFGALVLLAARWATNQTRLTMRGVSGFSMSGLQLPRRVELAWQEIGRIEESAHRLTLHGRGATVQIGLALYADPRAVVDFVKSKVTHLTP
jgi:hypothetical protein